MRAQSLERLAVSREFAFPCASCGVALRALPVEAGDRIPCPVCEELNRVPRLHSRLRVRPPQEKEHMCPFFCQEHVQNEDGKCTHTSRSLRLRKAVAGVCRETRRRELLLGSSIGLGLAAAASLLFLL